VNQQRQIGSLCIYKCRYIYSLPNCLAKIPRQSGGLYTVYIYSISICTLEAYLLPNCLAKNTRQSGSLHIYIQIYIYTRSLTTYICIFFLSGSISLTGGRIEKLNEKKPLSTLPPVRPHLSEPGSAKKLHSRDSVMRLFFAKKWFYLLNDWSD
jgi:hypothetical protein